MAKAIFISGVIGSGKTTLAEKISKEYSIELKKEDITTDDIVPKINVLYSTFDPDIIFEVQSHFLDDSSDMSEELNGEGVFVFDTFPFFSQMVFLEALRNLDMLSEDQFNTLRLKLVDSVENISFMDHLHIHCATPKDIFQRIHKRKSFEVNSFDVQGNPNPKLVRLIEELDISYYDLVLSNKTVFSEDPKLGEKINRFLDGK